NSQKNQQQQGAQPGAQAQQALHIPGGLEARRFRGFGHFGHGTAQNRGRHGVARRSPRRFGGGQRAARRRPGGQAGQPTRRPHGFGHQEPRQGQNGPRPRFQAEQPFASQAHRHADDAGGQHGQDKQITPAAVVVVAQAQGDGQPRCAPDRAQFVQHRAAERQAEDQDADDQRGQRARPHAGVGPPAPRGAFPPRQHRQIERGQRQGRYAGVEVPPEWAGRLLQIEQRRNIDDRYP